MKELKLKLYLKIWQSNVIVILIITYDYADKVIVLKTERAVVIVIYFEFCNYF